MEPLLLKDTDWKVTLERLPQSKVTWLVAIVILAVLAAAGVAELIPGMIPLFGAILPYFVPAIIAWEQHNASAVFVT